MARKDGKDRGLVFRRGKWWVRLHVNGREKWYRADTKSQAKALYGRLKAEIREGTYFPEKFKQGQDITLRAWITRYQEGVTSKGLRNMQHYGKFWSRFLGNRLLTDLTADDLRRVQARMLEKGDSADD